MIMSADCSLAPPPMHDGGSDPLPESLTRYTGFLVAKAHQRLWVMFGEECRAHGVEVQCVGILHLLEEGGAMSQQQLGRRLRIDRTTMVKLVDAMEKSGFARRADNPSDRRAYLVEMTSQGRKALKAMQMVAEKMERKLFTGFTDAERKVIHRALLSLAG